MSERKTPWTPGPWSFCCDKCHTVSSPHHPIADVTKGEWGDTYPSIRPQAGTSSLEGKFEACIERITYGSVDPETSKANAHLIAAAPCLAEALADMLAGWKYIRDNYGDLSGVGWDRAKSKAEAAFAKAGADPMKLLQELARAKGEAQ